MPATPKQTIVYGMLAKTPEATYATPLSLVAGSDGALLAVESVITGDYVYDGKRQSSAGSTGLLKYVPPTGRFGHAPVKIEPRGLGSAYSAALFPPDSHHFMRMSGHAAAFSGGAGSEQILYTPVSSGFASGTLEGYGRGEKAPMAGCFADFGFTIDQPSIPIFDFDVLGVANVVETDVALPGITYNNVTQPPTATSVVLTIGNYTGAGAYKIDFKKNLTRQIRHNINGLGISGYACGDRAPTLTIEIEADVLTVALPWTGAATINGYMLKDSAQPIVLSFQVGTVQYNKWKFQANQAICTKAVKGNSGPVATWTLTFVCAVSAPTLDDDYSVLWN